MIPVLLLGAAALLGGGLIAVFWKEVSAWLQRGIKKILEKFNLIVLGVKVFVKKISEAIQEISKHYSQKKNGQWEETIVTREVSSSEVPPEILAKAQKVRGEVDVSNEMKLELS